MRRWSHIPYFRSLGEFVDNAMCLDVYRAVIAVTYHQPSHVCNTMRQKSQVHLFPHKKMFSWAELAVLWKCVCLPRGYAHVNKRFIRMDKVGIHMGCWRWFYSIFMMYHTRHTTVHFAFARHFLHILTFHSYKDHTMLLFQQWLSISLAAVCVF